MAASALAFSTHSGLVLDDMRFNFEFFMIWLLPPIIFEAGFNMNRRAFFENLLPTSLFAFGGTVFSTAVVGSIVYGAGQAGLCHPLSGLAALYFGALISATDPVTVLAVFQRLGVKSDLFAMVFGESVMNDAVAIVLSRTLLSFKTAAVSYSSVGLAFVTFVEIFAGSLLVGVAYGIASALAYKHLRMHEHDDALYVEAAMIVTFAWGANYTAEALELSGIVAILFCGIVMAQYTRDNLSDGAVVLTARLFKVIALLAETFVFVYLGMAAFALPIFERTQWRLVAVAICACVLGRTHIYLLSAAVNCVRRAKGARALASAAVGAAPTAVGAAPLPPISLTYQHVMVFSGLRGGVAFAIAAVGYEHDDFHSHDDSLAIMQTTLMVALFTIFVLGGTIGDLARLTGVLTDPTHELAARARHEHARTTKLHHINRAHIRPFLTHHPARMPSSDGWAGDEPRAGVELHVMRSSSQPAAHAPAAALLPIGPSSSHHDPVADASSDDEEVDVSCVRAPALDVHYDEHHHSMRDGRSASRAPRGQHARGARAQNSLDGQSLHDAHEQL